MEACRAPGLCPCGESQWREPLGDRGLARRPYGQGNLGVKGPPLQAAFSSNEPPDDIPQHKLQWIQHRDRDRNQPLQDSSSARPASAPSPGWITLLATSAPVSVDCASSQVLTLRPTLSIYHSTDAPARPAGTAIPLLDMQQGFWPTVSVVAPAQAQSPVNQHQRSPQTP
jgi:hypothetical protein